MPTTTEYFKTLVPIANPSGREATIREFIQGKLQSLGWDDQVVDDAGNLLVRIPGDSQVETLLLSAHMDSVPPCEGIQPVEDTQDGRQVIRSSGKTILGADDKSGIAVILRLAERLSQSSDISANRHPLELMFSTGEEVGLIGAKAFDLSQCQAKMGFVLDGEGDLGEIFTAAPSQMNLLLECHGVASHAGIAPESGESAIHMAMSLIHDMPTGRLSEDTTMNVGVIEGGNAINIVPALATIRAEARSHDEAALDQLIVDIKALCDKLPAQFPKGHVVFTPTKRYTRYGVSPDHPAVIKAQKACQLLNIAPKLARMNIGSDAHVLNHAGLATVVLGMGFHFSHSLGEYIYVDELERVTDWVWEIIHSHTAH